jgi:hypothetical protein
LALRPMLRRWLRTRCGVMCSVGRRDGSTRSSSLQQLLLPACDLLPENWSSYDESPTPHNGRNEEDSLWANDTHRSRSSASSAKRR